MNAECPKCLAARALEGSSSTPIEATDRAHFLLGWYEAALENVRDVPLALCAEHKREQRKARSRDRAEWRASLEVERAARAARAREAP